jgi:hypothetical protein
MITTDIRAVMNTDGSVSGCVGWCEYFNTVSGTCEHDNRQLVISHMQRNPDDVCPIYDLYRTEEMQNLEGRLCSE